MRTLAFVLAVAVTTGCDVYDETLLDRDAGTTGGGGACPGSIEPPMRPSAPDDGEDIGEVVYAVKDVVFDQGGERWADIGYNLDGICSEPPDIESECVPPNERASPETDGTGGIDNAFGHHLFPTVELTVPGLEETARGYQERGIGAPVLRIRGWNGEPNDSRVDVTAAISVFGVAGGAADTDPPEAEYSVDDGPTTPSGDPLSEPAWDGNDWFWVRSDNFLDGNPERPHIRDDNGYIANGTLVMTLPERTDFIFPGDEIGLLVRLTGAVATAKISDDRSTIEKATVAGRWSILDLLTTPGASTAVASRR